MVNAQSTTKDQKCVKPIIAIGLPTRGIIDTLTIESIIKNAEGHEVIWLFTNDLPLPDSRFDITDRFLASKADYILWVDDDVVMPDGFLDKMVSMADKDTMATGTYYMQNGMKSAHFEGNQLTQCGFGCVLIHRNVYLNTPKPWYSVNKTKLIFGNGPSATIKWVDNPKRAWGGEDIWFYHQSVEEAGFKIVLVGDVGHLRIRDWGSKYLNHGKHDIYFLDEKGQEGFEANMTDAEWKVAEREYIESRKKEMKDALEKK
jgi:hypothetical protein